MRLAVERDDTLTKATYNMERVSSNTMNHADKNFESVDDKELDWRQYPEEAAELLCQLESDMILTCLSTSKPSHEKEQVFVTNTIERISSRFSALPQQPAGSDSLPSSRCILEHTLSHEDIESQLRSWRSALKELERCNDAGIIYNMNTISGIGASLKNATPGWFRDHIDGLIQDPVLVPLPNPGSASMFEKTKLRPSWAHLDTPPSIRQTLEEWHLTEKQAEFAVCVLSHFRDLEEGRNPEQLLALCLGAPGTGKSQTLLAILWHMAQYKQSLLRQEVATCAFTGGAAMLISTPHTTPMTTCHQFQINLKGPSKTLHSSRTECLQYVFINEFLFLSYRHLKDIAEQVTLGLGEQAQKHKPFGGMNFVFFGDYEQLSKPEDYAMYYGAAAEENLDSTDMNTWFCTEMDHHLKKSSCDPVTTFVGRNLWTSVNTIRTLTVQKRQDDTTEGLLLMSRCQALREEDFPYKFFDSIQEKTITEEQLTSHEWSTALYIIMRHSLRVPIDLKEAMFQAQRQSKRFIQWKTIDTIHGQALPPPFQLIVDKILIDKIPRIQYFYEGMPIAFVDNNHFAAGNATNNLGYAVSIALDPRKPPDDLSMTFRELKYLPAYVLVHVPNAQMDQLYPDLPPKVIPTTPNKQSHSLRLGDNRYNLQNGKNSSYISVTRLGMRWIGVHAVTQYFRQGMSLVGRKCIIDLMIPEGPGPLNDYAQSVLVMLSRHKTDNDWALLHPLWTPENEIERLRVIDKMRQLLCKNPDLHAELRRIHSIETDISDTRLQDILAKNAEVAAYIHATKS